MKFLLSLVLAVAFGAAAYADIQQPPMMDQGPTRKFGRGFSNLVFGFMEVPATIENTYESEGTTGAFGFGLTKGLGRMFFRMGVGTYEMITFPFPCYKRSYRQPYQSNIPWILSGYQEFPPEMGWESRYNYCVP